MNFIRLGSTGLVVSRLCLGMMTFGSSQWRDWVLDEGAAEPIVRRAVDQGITFFDTADMYSAGASETVTGKLLRGFFPSREDYVLATKVYHPMGKGPSHRGLSRKHVLAAVDDSLRRLGTDYIDLYQIHRWDPETPIEETMEALHDIVRAGKVRYLGASSMHTWQFAKARHVAQLSGWTPFVSMQPHHNLVYREEEREMLPYCRDAGVGVIPWSPLARGLLAGGRTRLADGTVRSRTDNFARRLYGDQDLGVVDAVATLAETRGVPSAQIALAWSLGVPGVTAPIVGASKPEHVDDAVAALSISLEEQEIQALEAPYFPHPVLGHY